MSTAPPGLDSARAWGVTAASFIAMLTTFGVAYSFGAFLVPMSTDLGSGRATTSAVFSLTTLILFGFGALSGAIVDRVGPRPVLLFGAVFFGGGLVITARADSLWQAFLGHAVGVGLGVACSYVPLVAVVGGWFERRRTLAVGVAVSGIGLGTLLVAPLSAALISSLGWRDAYLGCLRNPLTSNDATASARPSHEIPQKTPFRATCQLGASLREDVDQPTPPPSSHRQVSGIAWALASHPGQLHATLAPRGPLARRCHGLQNRRAVQYRPSHSLKTSEAAGRDPPTSEPSRV